MHICLFSFPERIAKQRSVYIYPHGFAQRKAMLLFCTMMGDTELERRERKAHLLDELNSLYHEDTITVQLPDAEDIFDRFDPSPMHERSIDGEVEAYLLKQLAHISPKSRIAVNFIVPQASDFSIEVIKKAFANHFKIRAEEQLLITRKARHKWLVSLLFGMGILAVLLFLAYIMRTHAEGNAFLGILSESFSIIGWVALWEPATYFLYGHWDDIAALHTFMRMHRAAVTVVSAGG